MLRKRLLAILAALAMAVGLTVAVASPALAYSTPVCDPSGSLTIGAGSPTFGQMRWCEAQGWTDAISYEYWMYFEVDDVLTDGYAVHIEVKEATHWGWPGDFVFNSVHGECQSTGAVVACSVGPWVTGTSTPSGDPILARLVLGRAYTPAQHIAFGATWTVGNL